MERTTLNQRDRRALAAVAVQFFANGTMTASFMARAPQIRDGIGVAVEAYGLLLTLAATIGILASLLAGRIIQRSSTRRLLYAGAFAMVVSLPIIGVANTPAVWLVGMFTYVFFDTLVDISMNLQGSWLSARRHAPVMNRLHGLWSIGTLAGGLGAVTANRLAMSPFAHLSIVAVVMTFVLTVAGPHLLPKDEEAYGGSATNAAVSAVQATLERRTSRVPIVLLVLAGMFAIVMEATGSDWATFRLADDFNASAALASGAFVAFTVGMTGMRFGGDFVQFSLGRMRLHRLSVGIAAAGFGVASLVDSAKLSIAGFMLVGVGVATFMPKLYDDAARLPGRPGAGLGSMTAGMRVASLVTPAAVGALAGTSLPVGAAIAIVALPAAIGLVVVAEWNELLLQRD